MTILKNQVEALLFSSGRKMTVEELRIHLAIGSEMVIVEALEELRQEYDDQNRAMMVVNEGDLWKLAVREKHMDLARKINPNTELTKSMMETLAVIAWKQPITQSEVIHIRTNKAYEHIAEMEKMGFLIKEKYGRTYMLKLTQKFFDYFDLRDAQSARDLFKHVKENEETQKKLQEARAAAGIPEEGLSTGEVVAAVTEGDTMEEHNAEKHQELEVVTETTTEDLVAEDNNPNAAAEEENVVEQHEDAVEAGVVEEELDNTQDRDQAIADDEIETEEAGFVQGYEADAADTQDHAVEDKQDDDLSKDSDVLKESEHQGE
jgi:segregation and condensation protein B